MYRVMDGVAHQVINRPRQLVGAARPTPGGRSMAGSKSSSNPEDLTASGRCAVITCSVRLFKSTSANSIFAFCRSQDGRDRGYLQPVSSAGRRLFFKCAEIFHLFAGGGGFHQLQVQADITGGRRAQLVRNIRDEQVFQAIQLFLLGYITLAPYRTRSIRCAHL